MYRRSFSTIILTIVCLFLAGGLLTGCNSKTQAEKPTDNITTPVAKTPEPTSQSVKLTLYFPNSEATGLIPTDRTVEVKDQQVINVIFIELDNPPSGLEKPLPSGTKLLNATISADGIASINLSPEFKANFGGGSAGEQMTMYSIVNTLTALPNVSSVQFLLAGDKHDGILGHLDTRVPIKRNESLIIKST
ncbi:GerMN domain-containing protein [Desulfosporosinus sp.]|uniref:GerMN domain-containing protein n=1 Tax=Desulfosporosinus sp. TaxID=157907 RepID=UPI000E8DCACA|nr:GerMN domain-containing protein [Desulfosporosinus sp.]MBC2727357.1 GerMN domain-containing protein [Desulfosporosinus sp.]HBV86063.1 spore gernimation protein [Desulfosporosinus sp.]